MNHRKWRIAMDVPTRVRGLLLKRFKPRFTQAYCWSVTWAFDVEENYSFDPEVQTCIVHGLYSGTSFQTFAVNLGKGSHRPDGRLLHIVHATAPGVQPAHAGLFDAAEAFAFPEPVTFDGRLMRYPMWRKLPTIVTVEAP